MQVEKERDLKKKQREKETIGAKKKYTYISMDKVITVEYPFFN